MAYFSFLSYILFASLLSLSCLNNVLCLEKSFGFEGKVIPTLRPHQTYHTLQLSSLMPAAICSPSTKVNKNKRTMKVVDKHGPCSQINQDKNIKRPTDAEILQQDQARVNSIQSRLSKDSIETDTTTVPAKSGATIGSANYIVTVGLGTPKTDLSLIFDTGSDITWTQCVPCSASNCYSQQQPLFDPSKSTSYSNFSCSSQQCSMLTSDADETQSCSSPTSPCIYGVTYGDGSYTTGYFSKERISIPPSDVFDDFLFGCGHNNQGLFRGAAGLLGLGRGKLSFVEQTAQKYDRMFSYCLPSTSSSTGFLSFGKDNEASGDVIYIPLSTVTRNNSFYGLQLEGISINGRRVSISASLFSSSGTIIDSGTVITRLPATAYSAFRSEFRQQMKDYTFVTVPADSLLDTCYDFSGNEEVNIPKISFLFGDGTTVDLDSTGVFYGSDKSKICLAFAGNNDDTGITILGNVQQRRLEVVYDIGGGRIGFRPSACA
ncbi:hypothetical protein FEM48_Zijuj06G0064200 [Ziziphus jujuba var. spinosa]|uniref:Peptidase A1 domain-containing protein n=1 Tax=Ziziphus jujuba var. spinosa TaxID=714518 RepID=A0A978V7P4_ZIZJJ|nr:hypothetical protein FEM48_Zijuj06G0064200 [Ziziphus jujuba var. spinosa]